jgi:hypothetical protein
VTIPTNSRSYPLLALAQRMCVDYEHVLSYSDVVEWNLFRRSPGILGTGYERRHVAANDALTERQKMCVENTVRAEWRRREETSA